MGYLKYMPFKEGVGLSNTNHNLDYQIWQELVSIRFKKNWHLKGRTAIAPWIDQAKQYFLDSEKTSWRSSGLLYYYSFLNLAKALIVAYNKLPYKYLNTSAIFHGLRAELQDITKLSDYEISIYPYEHRGKKNVFPNLYEVFTEKPWPFKKEIKLTLKELFPYCEDISAELSSLFGIESCMAYTRSLIRDFDKQLYFEIILTNNAFNNIKNEEFINLFKEFLTINELSEIDKIDWHNSYSIDNQLLVQSKILRTKKIKYDISNRKVLLEQLMRDVYGKFSGFALFCPNNNIKNDVWTICPKFKTNGEEIMWHPLLSDYLIAFALSSILRYQPQIVKDNSVNSFLAEAWSNQSAIASLKYFLMKFTNPSLVLLN